MTVIAAVLASQRVEHFLSEYSKNLLIILLIIITVMTVSGKGIYDVAVSVFKEGIVPGDRITVFVEDIQFELPTIPEELMRREVALSEID